MIRWIAFDDETAEAVVSKFKRGGAEIHGGEPLDAVLEFGKPSLMLLPSTKPGRVLLAQFQPKVRPVAIESREPIAFETMGFLGLTDQPVYSNTPADEENQEKNKKKRWWQRRSA
jgi:hypothetical protein